MPRRRRTILPGTSHHVTHRGNSGREIFRRPEDRRLYLSLLRESAARHEVAIEAYCLMTNHVHLVAAPAHKDGIALMIHAVHGRFARILNRLQARSGHLWENRHFCCALEGDHAIAALRYVELNPVRAGLVEHAAEYRWSSAAAHCGGADPSGLLDLESWHRRFPGSTWHEALAVPETAEDLLELRHATRSRTILLHAGE